MAKGGAKGGGGRGVTLGFLKFILGLDGLQFEEGLTASAKQLKAAERKIAATGAKISSVGQSLAIGITAPFTALIASSIPAATESAQALAQVEAAQKSMGGASKLTTAQLQDMAGHLQDISNFDDDDILKNVTANLLTFGKVGGATFQRAEQSIVDISARMHTDLQSATIMVGKALNDPVKGFKALSRAGIQFTDEQKATIQSMVETGNVAGAQAVMLGELERQFGGAAKAQRDATPGAGAAQQWRTFQETIGAIALKFLPPLNVALENTLKWFNGLSPATQTWVLGAVAVAAALGPILLVVGGLTTALAPLLAIISTVAGTAGLGALALAAAPVLAVVAALVAAWLLFGDKIGPVLTGLWTKAQEVLGPKLLALFDAVTTTLTQLWTGPFGTAVRPVIAVLGNLLAALVGAMGQNTIGILSAFLDLATGVFTGVGKYVKLVAALLNGDWAGAWTAAKQLVSGAVATVLRVIEDLAPGTTAAVKALYDGVKTWLLDRLNAIWDSVKVKIETVKGWFFGLYDAVVGHSYIPDMVDGIETHIARLDGVMVRPIAEATAKAGEAFRALRDSTQGLLDRLFPEQAAVERLKGEFALLDRALADKLITPEVYAAARERLTAELAKLQDAAKAQLGLISADIRPEETSYQKVADEVGDFAKSLPGTLGEPVKKTTDQVIRNFAEMARSVIGSIRNLSDTIKNGDFFDVLQGILDIILQLGQSGVFGSKFNAGSSGGNGGSFGGFGGFRANGGPTVPGKSYIVGENGPEWFTPGLSGRVTPGNDNGGGGRVTIVPSPYFNAVVDDRARAVAVPIGAQAAHAGAQGAQLAAARAEARRLA